MRIYIKYYPTIENMKKLWGAIGHLQKQIAGGGGGGGVTSVNGDVGPAVVLDKTDIGLSNVDNTSDANKPVSTATSTALGLKVDKDGTKVLSDVNFSTAKDAKLTGIATGATANDTDANLKNRANHTGTQAATTIVEDTTHRFATDAEKTTWNAKQAPLVSGTNIKTINGVTILGSGDMVISGGGGAVDSVNSQTGVVVLDTDDISDTSSTNKYTTAAEKTKLSGIATGATANSTDATLLARANHTGVQAISTVTGLQAALDAKVATSLLGANSGVATLDSGGKVPVAQLPALDITTEARAAVSAGDGLDYNSTTGVFSLAPLESATPTSSHTLVITDAGKLINMFVASANNLTVPPNSSVAFPIGTQILVTQGGAGQTTLVAGAGVTLSSAGGKLKTTLQYSTATLIKVATDAWLVSGDLTT